MRGSIYLIACSLPAVLLAAQPTGAAEGNPDRDLEGTIEILYRDVSRDGSVQKYEEDFDGLDSGVRLSGLELDWHGIDSKLVDSLRLDAGGLGGDPYERAALRLGRKGLYDLRLSHTKQSYLYNLFQVEFDQDASTWDSDRRSTDLGLTFYAGDNVDVFFDLREVRREGVAFFTKDINRDLFQLETPLDQDVRHYAAGARFRIGSADVLFRHALRRYDYDFHNSTTGNAGLSMFDLATLTQYDWVQRDRGEADLTTLTVSLPLGDRVQLTATAFGTLLGQEEIDSQVSLDATGTSFRGTCAITGGYCDATTPCAAIPGNGCVADPYSVSGGTSTAAIETDYLAFGGDLSVRIAEPLDFHLQVHSLSRETTGIHDRDLDGNGVPDDTEGTINDVTPGSTTSVEYGLDTVTGLFVYEPSSKVRVRAGYRSIERDLERSGFEYGTTEYRNTNYDSSSDDTLILGLKLKPVAWFHLDADFEQGDVAQALTAAAPAETDRLRVRASFRHGSATRLDLGYLSHENTHTGFDFRRPGDCGPGDDVDSGCWNSVLKGSTQSASLWHKSSENLDFWLRWARNDVDGVTRIHFDTDLFFGSTDVGNSVYLNDNTEWSGRIHFRVASAWRAFLRAQLNESDGENSIVGATFSNTRPIFQDYADIECGVTYSFPNDLYVGARFRSFDYDDRNNGLDYDGEILSLLVGFDF